MDLNKLYPKVFIGNGYNRSKLNELPTKILYYAWTIGYIYDYDYHKEIMVREEQSFILLNTTK